MHRFNYFLKSIVLFGCLFFMSCSGGNDDSPVPPTKHRPDPNPTTGGAISHTTIGGYQLDIYTPENYTEEKEYPVIYFNDGQSLFDFGGLEMDNLLNSLIADNLIEEVIVVGIYSNGNRILDYTPYEDEWMVENWNLTKPKAAEYTRKVIESIIPYIDENYSTVATNLGRAFMGYSLGGLQATWASLKFPEYFSMVAAFSPSYWVGNYSIFYESPSANPDLKIWFDIGTAEWNWYIPFQRSLISQGFHYGTEAFYYEVAGGAHDFLSWKSRIQYPILAFFGKDKNFTPRDMEIHTEVIPSQSRPGRAFLRINPVVTTQNGIKYSLAEAATYTVENPDVGTVLADGRFSFKLPEDLHVRVQYQNLIEIHTIHFSQVQIIGGG